MDEIAEGGERDKLLDRGLAACPGYLGMSDPCACEYFGVCDIFILDDSG